MFELRSNSFVSSYYYIEEKQYSDKLMRANPPPHRVTCNGRYPMECNGQEITSVRRFNFISCTVYIGVSHPAFLYLSDVFVAEIACNT